MQQISLVINYDLPANRENYIHRSAGNYSGIIGGYSDVMGGREGGCGGFNGSSGGGCGSWWVGSLGHQEELDGGWSSRGI